MKKIALFGVVLLCGQLACGGVKASLSGDEEGAEETLAWALLQEGKTGSEVSHDIFPISEEHHSLKYFLDTFQPFVHKALWDDFEKGWSVIYGGTTRLSVEKETEHIRCLFYTLIGMWQTRAEGEEWLDNQQLAIYCMFSVSKTHMNLIRATDADLADRIEKYLE